MSEVTTCRLEQRTNADPELKTPKDIIIGGWPDSARHLPKNLRDVCSCRDELSVEDGLVLKGDRVIIPTAMRGYILRNNHAGHQIIEKNGMSCWRRVSAC